MRYAVLFKQRPSVIASWPAWELDLLDHFLAREPEGVDRVEIAVARLSQAFSAAHRKEGSPVLKLMEFLPYKNAWPIDDGRYNEIDMQVLQELL